MPSPAGYRPLAVIARCADASNAGSTIQPSGRARAEDHAPRAVEQVVFRKNHSTIGRRRRAIYAVGLITPDLTDPLAAELAAGVERGLHRAGTVPLLVATGDSPIQRARAMHALRMRAAKGFVICPALDTDRAGFCDAKDAQLPVVSLMHRFGRERTSFVGPDNYGGAESATAHLIASGHRRIAFLGGHEESGMRQERLEGYAVAMRAAGLRDEQAVVVESTPSREGGLQALEWVLASGQRPTAALCFNDAVAFGVLSGLARHGIKAGPEFAVVGFGGMQDAQFANPPLTTVAIDAMSLGERAAEILVEQIDDPSLEPIEHRGPTRLVVRDSCGSAHRRFSA